jgi:hypothetical protein
MLYRTLGENKESVKIIFSTPRLSTLPPLLQEEREWPYTSHGCTVLSLWFELEAKKAFFKAFPYTGEGKRHQKIVFYRQTQLSQSVFLQLLPVETQTLPLPSCPP